MYSSGYSQVNKQRQQANKKVQYHTKGKSCGYYMRIIFFFSSLIQSLIIVSLVLFLIYGKDQDSASLAHIQDLEESFSRLSIENVALRLQRKNLTTLLNSTMTEKAQNDWDLTQFRNLANVSLDVIKKLEKDLKLCNLELATCRPALTSPPIRPLGIPNCGLLAEQFRIRLQYVESNFTHTVQKMRREMDQMAIDRDNLNLQAINLRKDKSKHEKELEFCRTECKSVLVLSLKGISNVTNAFLKKIDSLSSSVPEFHLTCEKQMGHLEQIRSNCTSLSKEIESKFHHYLESMGEQVSSIQATNGRLKAENWRLTEDYRECSQNRSGLIEQHRQNLDNLQQKHDQSMGRVLLEKLNLQGEITVLNNNVNLKNAQIVHLTQQVKELNATCMSKTPFRTAMNPAGCAPSTGSYSSRTIFSSSASAVNKQPSTGMDSLSPSIFSTGSGSSTGSASNKLGSSGGALSFAGSNPSQSSSGTGSSKPSLSGRSSSTPGSSPWVPNPNLSTSGTGSSKATVNAKSSTGSGSTSSTSKSGSSSSGLSWFGFGSSSSTSKSGSGTGNGPSGGTGNGPSGGTGNGPSVSVAQHVQDLQRLINPPGPEEKKDLSRVMG